MLYRFLLVTLLLLPATFTALSAPDVERAMQQAQQITDEMRTHTSEVLDRAETLSTSPEFLDELNREAARAMQNIDTVPTPALPTLPEPTPELLQRTRTDINRLLDRVQDPQSPTTIDEKSGPQLYLFVSFSMPDITLKRLLVQASRIDGSLILRGLIDNDFGKTKDKIAQLLEADAMGNTTTKGGLAIDPTLFERFDISQVPSFVLTNTPAKRCSETECPKSDYARLSGDTTIEYVLETMAREAPAMKQSAQTLLDRLRQGS